MDQINMFEEMYKKFTFNKKKITMFESFAGIGSQFFAFIKDVEGIGNLQKQFKFELDVVGISEWDIYSILSYDSIHTHNNEKIEITKKEMEDYFIKFILSSDGKNPMTQKQIERLSYNKSLKIYSAIIRQKNYGSITTIKEIPQVDIFTYSFPCQDISLAGNQKGFSRNSGTRSGLLWEVERLLKNQEKIKKLPKVLLMENVKALVGMKYKDDFVEWQLKLESLGYKNYWEVLNAKNYGIPQNRERVFMVSILGDYSYNFPNKIHKTKTINNIIEEDHSLMPLTKHTMDIYLNIIKEHDIIKKMEFDKYYIEFPIVTREAQTRLKAQTFLNQISPTLLARDRCDQKVVFWKNKKGFHLRRLYPIEYFRLMGFSDELFYKAKKVTANTYLYHQAGNSIVVDVLYYIFKELF